MASFCVKAGPLGDCTPGCAVTCSCLVSSRLRQSREKAQPLPGVVLGEKNLFTDAESLFLCEVPPAYSVLLPELTVGSSAAVPAPPGRVLRGSALPGCSFWCSVPAGGTARGTQHPSMWLCWSSALPRPPVLLAPLPAATPTLGSAALHDPAAFHPRCAPVSPQKQIHLCGCPCSPHLDDAGIRARVCFFFLSLRLVVQPATGDRQRLPNCILHLFISKRAFVRCKRRPHYWL